MLITEATLEDIPELAALLAILFAQEADFTPDRHRQQQGLRQIISQPGLGRIFVLRYTDKLVGMVSVLFSISTALGGRVAVLEDMVVHPEARGSGLGTALLQHAITFAQVAGCLRISLLTDTDNTDALRFYARQGFVPSQMKTLRLALPS